MINEIVNRDKSSWCAGNSTPVSFRANLMLRRLRLHVCVIEMRLQVHQTASCNPLFSHPFCSRLDDVGNIVIVPLSLFLFL